MEKYATYNVFENKDTKEIKRIPFTNEVEMVKLANHADWILLEKDPEDGNENKGSETKKSS